MEEAKEKEEFPPMPELVPQPADVNGYGEALGEEEVFMVTDSEDEGQFPFPAQKQTESWKNVFVSAAESYPSRN